MSEVETRDDVEQVEPEATVQQLAEESPEQKSLLDSLRRKHKELETNKETLIPLPGYEADPPILLAKYRLLEGKEVDMISSKVMRETKNQWDRNVLAAVDVFIAACEGLYYDMDDGTGPQPMSLNGDPIMGYTTDLAEALEFTANSARQVVFGVFTNNEVAIMQHNVRLSRWMSNTSRKVDEDFLG